MSRDIRFRVWDGSRMWHLPHNRNRDQNINVRMSEDGQLVATWEGGFTDHGGWPESIEEKPDWIVMQYTGLEDKKGTEIWEGDAMEHGGIIGYVVFHPSGAWGVSQKPYPLHGCWFFNDPETRDLLLDDMVVIGNIHEHPHLLEAQEA